jgi:6-phosphogluconolactonase (cycloisomerase 2 family)
MLHKLIRPWLSLAIGLALLLGPGGAQAQEADPSPGDPPPDGLVGAAQEVTPADVSVQAAGGGYVYALLEVNGGANQIYGFQVNELTGELTALSGFPVATGGNGSDRLVSELMVYDAANARLYVINDGSNTVSAYSVNRSTGALIALPFSPISLGSGDWTCLAVHPGGSPLIVGDFDGTPTVASFAITGSSVTPAPGSAYSTDTERPFSCAFSRDGNYLYVGGGGNSLFGFSVNAATGALAGLPFSPFTSGADSPVAYATDSTGRVFLANFSSNQVRAFTTSGGVPSPVLSNPFTAGLTQATHGLLHPNGFYLVADRIGNRVGVYRISGSGSGTTLAAVSGSPFSSGGSLTNILALNQSGAFLFAANGDTRNLTTFSFNAATSALTSPETQPANTLGAAGRLSGLAYAGQPQPPSPPGSGFVYALRDVNTGNQIYGYSVNETTGALTELPGFPLGTGGNGNGADAFQRIAYDPVNSRLYAVNALSNTVSAFSVSRATGALTPLPFSPISVGTGEWYCIAVSPNGSTLVVGELLGGRVASYNITASTAITATGSPYASGAEAASCAFSQDGAYFYAGGNPANFAGFSVNRSNSLLTALSGSPYNSGNIAPLALATDSLGRLFLANLSNQVRVFTTGAGVPSPVLGNPFTSGLSLGVSGVLHPSGYYLVADRIGNRVGVYRINGSGPSTTLTAVSGSPFGSGGSFTQVLALNRAGTLLFAANGDSRNVTTYAVDGATGALNGVSIQPPGSAGGTGRLTGLAYVPGLNYVFLPLVQR